VLTRLARHVPDPGVVLCRDGIYFRSVCANCGAAIDALAEAVEPVLIAGVVGSLVRPAVWMASDRRLVGLTACLGTSGPDAA
jgi:hypothetical protein